jgi:hypothetical protein
MARKKNYTTECSPCSPEKWEIEEDLRAVIRAKAVHADLERMKKVKALAKEKRQE